MMRFYDEIKISPMDISYIRINLLKNLQLDKMNIGDVVNIIKLEYGQEVVYQIKKVNNKDFIFKNLEIKKFVFNQKLFDIEVEKQMRNPKIDFLGKITNIN